MLPFDREDLPVIIAFMWVFVFGALNPLLNLVALVLPWLKPASFGAEYAWGLAFAYVAFNMAVATVDWLGKRRG